MTSFYTLALEITTSVPHLTLPLLLSTVKLSVLSSFWASQSSNHQYKQQLYYFNLKDRKIKKTCSFQNFHFLEKNKILLISILHSSEAI